MSNETKHTPGPWMADGVDIYQGDITGPRIARAMVEFDSIRDYAFSDARLIAAAPELLAALENLECEASAEIDPNSSLNKAILDARAAIAKAKNEVRND